MRDVGEGGRRERQSWIKRYNGCRIERMVSRQKMKVGERGCAEYENMRWRILDARGM